MNAERLVAFQRRHPSALFLLGVFLTLAAVWVLAAHAAALRSERTQTIAIGTELPLLQSRVSLLAANLETEDVQLAEATASREERAQAYVLAEGEADGPRTTRLVRGVADAFARPQFAVTDVSFSPTASVAGHRVTLMHLRGHGTASDIARFVSVLEQGSALTVRDVLTDADTTRFIQDVEEHSPSSLSAALQFLRLDLLSYAADPESAEDRMTRDMLTDVATDARLLLLNAGLSTTRSTLSPIAPALQRRGNVWPLPLMRLTSLQQDGDQWTMEWEVLGRMPGGVPQ